MVYFILAVATLSGILGWNHPDPETKAMCRFVGTITACVTLMLGGPGLVTTAATWVLP